MSHRFSLVPCGPDCCFICDCWPWLPLTGPLVRWHLRHVKNELS